MYEDLTRILVEKMHNLMQRQRTTLGRKRNHKRRLNTCSERDCCHPKVKVQKKGNKKTPHLHPHKRKYSLFFSQTVMTLHRTKGSIFSL